MKIEELKLKFSYRSMMLWECVMGKPFGEDNSLTSLIVLLWCIIEANNPNAISIEDFAVWIDDNPREFDKLCKWLAEERQRQNEMLGDNNVDESSTDKKKAKQE